MDRIEDKLHESGVHLRAYTTGKHLTTCPQCSPTRKKKKQQCLAVWIDERGFRAYCIHCEFKTTGLRIVNNSKPYSVQPPFSGIVVICCEIVIHEKAEIISVIFTMV